MNNEDSGTAQPIGQNPIKKAYQKPSVQIYGTLLEMTQAIDGDVGHPKDNGSNVAGTAAHNRT